MTRKVITEEQGEFQGFKYEVKLFSDGHRTGYVRIPDDVCDKMENSDEYACIADSIESVCCHGGITYSQYNKTDSDFLPEGWWIGFDCAHPRDAYDTAAAERAFGIAKVEPAYLGPTDLKDVVGKYSVKTLDFCRNECRDIVEQLLQIFKRGPMLTVSLTGDQIRVLLALLDCETKSDEPDWFLDEESYKIKTPFLSENNERSLQEHLNILLKKENFPEIF